MRNTLRHRRIRYSVVMIAVIALVAVFVIRLVDIQVVQAATLTSESVAKTSVPQTLYGVRGSIVDRNGTPLADSVTRYNITTAPKIVAGFSGKLGGTRIKTVSVHDALAALAAVSGGDLATMEKNISADPNSNFTYLVKGLDVPTYRKVMALSIPWIYPEKQAARVYPNGATAGNLTGFMGTDGAQAGLEYSYNQCLSATNGSETYERGLDGVMLPGSKVTTKEPVNGGTLQTTIDEDLQYMAEQDIATAAQSLKATSATATVSNAKTGEVLALADYPTVDPNNVTPTAQSDPGALGSRALTAAYEPGSTMKAIVASALIQEGKATPTSGVTVPYSRTFPWGGRISDAELHPTEKLTMTGVLAQSSNVGITELGDQLSAQTRFDYMKKFGLFQQNPDIQFPGQPSWPNQTSPNWDPQTNENSMFGQGIATTALQVANVYQTLANGGVRIPLHFVKGCTKPDGTVIDAPKATPTRVVSQSTATQVVDMLQSTFKADANGTLASMQPISGYNISAKTGTAQVALPNGKGYGPDTIISVVGMAPTEDPQYVVTVTFNKPQTDKYSWAAAPAFRTLMSQVLEKYRVAPSTATPTTYPSSW
ncbi:peptidoglycan D,D-transpeptidase FtsI family protein [Curtobacterium ammoniigenes]|uniref:peptidoglycan D,D-transpeptidase FtsI family protein n=1 Tax=Curtobacterium ammoniigenes TaxID=395387 RepID=UPI0008342A52|nr:penicillin-binding protein 2 [Curtobacterium ammoniigenes]